MNVMVVGLGSMGKRRIRLIKQIDNSIKVFGVDSRADRRQEALELLGVDSYSSLEEAFANELPDTAFVCTSPLSHYDITKKCIINRISVFSEINLINENHNELIELAKEKDCKLFLSSTPMYRREIEHITKLVKGYNGILNYIYHVGQFLPDWHPWENFKDYFVGDDRTNGCRELFAIELPWIINAFGGISDITVNRKRISNLEINCSDSYMVILEHENRNRGMLCFDVVAKPAVRSFTAYGQDFMVKWEGTPDSLKFYDEKEKQYESITLYDSVVKDGNYAANIIENMYIDEIKTFLAFMEGNAIPKHDFQRDSVLLDIIDKIEGKK